MVAYASTIGCFNRSGLSVGGSPAHRTLDAGQNLDALQSARCGQQVPFGRPRVVDEEHSPVAQEACRRLVAVPRDTRVCAAALRLHHPNIARVPSPAPTAISPVSSDAGTAAGLDGADALVTGVLALWPEGVQAVITAVIAANSARAPNRPTGLSVTRIHTAATG